MLLPRAQTTHICHTEGRCHTKRQGHSTTSQYGIQQENIHSGPKPGHSDKHDRPLEVHCSLENSDLRLEIRLERMYPSLPKYSLNPVHHVHIVGRAQWPNKDEQIAYNTGRLPCYNPSIYPCIKVQAPSLLERNQDYSLSHFHRQFLRAQGHP
jgi:hypothetical protein